VNDTFIANPSKKENINLIITQQAFSMETEKKRHESDSTGKISVR